MEQEPILKEIRRIRHEIEAECQNDPQKYYEHIQQIQKQYGNRLVRFKPKPALKLAKADLHPSQNTQVWNMWLVRAVLQINM